MIRRTAKWLFTIVLIVIMFAYAMFQGGFVSWFLFYSVVPLIIYAVIIGFFPLKSMKMKRILPNDAKHAGQSLKVTIEIKKSFFPLFYFIVEDKLNSKLTNKLPAPTETKAIFFPLFKRKLTYTYEIPTLPRGEHSFSHIVLKTGDLFGFIQKQAVCEVEDTLFVYPRIEQVGWDSSYRGTNEGKDSASQSKQDVATVVGIREYIAGDRLSWIDWKTTAKRNQLVTKQFEQESNNKTLLFLDNSVASYEEADDDLFEKAVTVTASLVFAIFRSGGKPIVAFGGKDSQFINESQAYEQQLYYELGIVEAIHEDPFTRQIQRVIENESRGYRIVLVTVNISDDLLHLFASLRQRSVQVDLFYVVRFKNTTLEANKLKVKVLRSTGANVHEIVLEEGG